MKIRKLQLKNIGVFDDETIEFQPCPVKDKAEIHIFTGQNGSGKSTLLMTLANSFVKEINISLSKRFRMKDNNQRVRFKTYLDDSSFIEFKEEVFPEKGLVIVVSEPPNTNNREIKEYIKQTVISNESYNPILSGFEFEFAVFAYSGYRFIKSESIDAIKDVKENPLINSLEFIKNYENLSINQWIANNLSKRAIEKEEGHKQKANKFDENIKNLSTLISEIVDYQIQFRLRTSPIKLVVNINNTELDFDVLPDGLRSLISWVGDLLMRLDNMNWENDLPIFERKLILLLDEIEVHLHPAWQRKVLPVVQKLFKNSQIFVSTHSPFVVNSVDDAWVYELKVENGKARVAEKSLTKTAYSYQTVLREVFDIDERFGVETQKELEDFLNQSKTIQQSNGQSKIGKKDFLKLAKNLASQSAELQSLVFLELARLSKETGEPYEL
jgi:predicted ATP-binding protein involved in virulence